TPHSRAWSDGPTCAPSPTSLTLPNCTVRSTGEADVTCAEMCSGTATPSCTPRLESSVAQLRTASSSTSPIRCGSPTLTPIDALSPPWSRAVAPASGEVAADSVCLIAPNVTVGLVETSAPQPLAVTTPSSTASAPPRESRIFRPALVSSTGGDLEELLERHVGVAGAVVRDLRLAQRGRVVGLLILPCQLRHERLLVLRRCGEELPACRRLADRGRAAAGDRRPDGRDACGRACQGPESVPQLGS